MTKPQATKMTAPTTTTPTATSPRYKVTKHFPTTKVQTLRRAPPEVIKQFQDDLQTSPDIKILHKSCSKQEAVKKVISDLRNQFWKHHADVWGYNPETGVSEEDVREIFCNAESYVDKATQNSPAIIQFANQWSYKISLL